MAASFPMVFLPRLGCSRAKSRESLVIVEGWRCLGVLFALLMTTTRAGPRPKII